MNVKITMRARKVIIVLSSLSLVVCSVLLIVDYALSSHREGVNITPAAMIVIDTAVNTYRVLLAVGLVLQLAVTLLLRRPARDYLALLISQALVTIFVTWWISTARMVNSLEIPSYRTVDHFLFLSGATLGDILVFLCIVVMLGTLVRNPTKVNVAE